MRYWLYSDGNILGPYAPAEMLALPAFTEDSLVCNETATGDNAEDWKSASQVNELSSVMGTGSSITAGVAAGAYQLEKMFSSTATGLEDTGTRDAGSYSELLETIDGILGSRGTDRDPSRLPEADYNLAEKFDIRLSRIQEELEAARWEKNLLLEKMRMKELEEKKSKARIAELEARVKGEMHNVQMSAMETEQVRHLSDLKERSEAIRKIEEIKKEELSLEKYLVPEPDAKKAQPFPAAGATLDAEPKKLKKMGPSGTVELKRNSGDTPAEEPGQFSSKLKSLGQTQPPAYVYGLKENAAPAPAPAPAPAAAPAVEPYIPQPAPQAAPAASSTENYEPLPQQAGGLMYDFTVVTPRTDVSSQQFRIETRQEGFPSAQPQPQYQAPAQQQYQAPAQQPQYQAPAPAFQAERFPSFNTPQQAPAAQPQNFGAAAQQPRDLSASAFGASPLGDNRGQAPVFTPFSAPAETAAAITPGRTQRMAGPEFASEQKAAAAPVLKGKATVVAPMRGRKGSRAFIAIILVFGFIAAGGLGYFFLGDGLSFSEFSMMNFNSKKKTSNPAQELASSAPAATSAAAAEGEAAPQPQADLGAAAAQPGQQPAPQPEQEPAPAAETGANENIRKALDVVKTYKLANGRGNIESWFANSFLSGGSGAANEEWTATPLHGDILVVQYRLVRPKQDPLIYQFEVDAAKSEIVRGINNNAIELLDASKDKTVSAAPVRKPAKKAAKAAPRKPSRPKELGQLALPDAPSSVSAEPDPTGFEQPENNEKVKYLKAQESDEELF